MASDDPDVPAELLDGVLARYRKLAGFDAQQVNQRYTEWQAGPGGGFTLLQQPGGGYVQRDGGHVCASGRRVCLHADPAQQRWRDGVHGAGKR